MQTLGRVLHYALGAPCAREDGGSRASGPLTGVGAGAAWPGPAGDRPACLCSWFFSGISRARAQQMLLSPANAPGAFLIRPSESSRGDYSLSGNAVAACTSVPGLRLRQNAPDLGTAAPRPCWPHIELEGTHSWSSRSLPSCWLSSLPCCWPARPAQPLTRHSPSPPSPTHPRTRPCVH